MTDINEMVYILFEVGLFDGSSPPSNKHYNHVDGEATINDSSGRKDFEEANRRVRVGNLGKGSRVTKNIGYYENHYLDEAFWGRGY